MPQNATPEYYFYVVIGGVLFIAILLYLIFRKDNRPAGVFFYIIVGLIGFVLLRLIYNVWNDAYVDVIKNATQPPFKP